MKTKKVGRKATFGVYAVMTVCCLAAGIGAWGAANGNMKNGKIDVPDASYTMPSNIPAENTPVNNTVTGVPYTEKAIEETQTTEEPTQEEKRTYVMPMGNYITKDYSGGAVVYSNTMRDWRVHDGIDLGDNRGQSVLAISDGKVTDVHEDVLWGTVLEISHGDGVVSRYCGLEKDTTPEVGTEVEAGVVIGKLGEIPIESKDGPHLHLEILVNGEWKDPLKWMAQ